MNQAFHYVFYPGHLGPRPMTELTSERGILWDAPVKRVPAPFVASLVNEGGFQLALGAEETVEALGRTIDKLDGRLGLKKAAYKPPRDGEPEVPVIVMPRGVTHRWLKAQLDHEDQVDADDEQLDAETTDNVADHDEEVTHA